MPTTLKLRASSCAMGPLIGHKKSGSQRKRIGVHITRKKELLGFTMLVWLNNSLYISSQLGIKHITPHQPISRHQISKGRWSDPPVWLLWTRAASWCTQQLTWLAAGRRSAHWWLLYGDIVEFVPYRPIASWWFQGRNQHRQQFWVFQPPMIVREVWLNILILPTYAKANYKKKTHKQTHNYATFMSQA